MLSSCQQKSSPVLCLQAPGRDIHVCERRALTPTAGLRERLAVNTAFCAR